MNKSIGVLGGDLRIVFLSKILAENGYTVYTYGINSHDFFSDNIKECKTIEEMAKICDNVISAFPFSKDGIYINAPFNNEKILINSALDLLKCKTLIAGSIKKEIIAKAHNNDVNIIDLMNDEKLTILNVIPTVEGAIQIAMENTEFTIHGSKCLILGFGRIGKLLCNKLKKLEANVSCMARKDADLAWIKTYGYKDIYIENLNESLAEYDIIFNTIPTVILDNEKLKLLKEKNRNVIIIDLASSPGGVDFEKAIEYKIKVIQALGLPGTVAPYTAAKYIKETLEKILN